MSYRTFEALEYASQLYYDSKVDIMDDIPEIEVFIDPTVAEIEELNSPPIDGFYYDNVGNQVYEEF